MAIDRKTGTKGGTADDRPWAFLEETGDPTPNQRKTGGGKRTQPGRPDGTVTTNLGPVYTRKPDPAQYRMLVEPSTVIWRDFVWPDGSVSDVTIQDLMDNGWFGGRVPVVAEWNARRDEVYEWLQQTSEEVPTDEDWLEDIFSGFGGGGGGGGRAAPVYVAPDPDQVEEMVKAYVIATTGDSHQSVIDKGVETYMSAHRQGFDQRESQEVDPVTAMKLAVRDTSEYKTVQKLRPESIDEMEWVPRRQRALAGMGLSAQRAQTLGIAQAQVGASDKALIEAGERAAMQDTGRMLESQRSAIKEAVGTVARMIY